MGDDQPGKSLGMWGFAFAASGAAIAFVMLIFIPALIVFALWYSTRGLPASPGD